MKLDQVIHKINALQSMKIVKQLEAKGYVFIVQNNTDAWLYIGLQKEFNGFKFNTKLVKIQKQNEIQLIEEIGKMKVAVDLKIKETKVAKL